MTESRAIKPIPKKAKVIMLVSRLAVVAIVITRLDGSAVSIGILV